MNKSQNIIFRNVQSDYLKQVFKETAYQFCSLYNHSLVLNKKFIKHTTMQAQPILNIDFFNPKNRAYRVDFRETTLIHEEIKTADLPEPVLRGWYAHELGHIVDYQNRGYWNMLKFGINYLFFDSCKKEAEKMADVYAIQYGFKDEIKQMKEYIINHADIDPKYRSRIKKYYLGPEEVEHLIYEIREEEQ